MTSPKKNVADIHEKENSEKIGTLSLSGEPLTSPASERILVAIRGSSKKQVSGTVHNYNVKNN